MKGSVVWAPFPLSVERFAPDVETSIISLHIRFCSHSLLLRIFVGVREYNDDNREIVADSRGLNSRRRPS